MSRSLAARPPGVGRSLTHVAAACVAFCAILTAALVAQGYLSRPAVAGANPSRPNSSIFAAR